MTKFFILSVFLVIMGFLVIEPFERKDDLVYAPAMIPYKEQETTTLDIDDVREIEKAEIKYQKKKLGKRNSHRAMNTIKRDEPLVMETEDIPFQPLE